MKKRQFIIPLLLVLLTHFINATTYENAEDGTTNGWSTYAQNSNIATITNIVDSEKNSKVISLNRNGGTSSFVLGHWSNSSKWNNKNNKIIQWSMKFSKSFIIYVSLETTEGQRYLMYRPRDNYKGTLNSGQYIYHGIGAGVNDGTWQTFTRDLEADLKELQPNNSIIAVNSFQISGEGLVDDIGLMLMDDSNGTEEDTLPPVITLNGDVNVTIEKDGTYIELNATAVDAVDGNVSVSISGTVVSSTVGVYILTYSATDVAGNESNVTRTVNVVPIVIVDTTPVITLNGDANVTIEKDGAYTELNATALDDVDGDVNVTISGTVDSSTVGVYTITYSAKDSSDNNSSKTRTVNVVNEAIVDTTPPVITLNGDVNITLTRGDVYTELGATALDDVDGNLNVTISGEIDTSTVGSYTITYTAKDGAENESTLSRVVNVIEKVVEYGVNIGAVEGHTVSRYDMARFRVSLKTEPESNVTIPIFSSDENEGKIQPINGDNTKLLFSPDNWNTPQMVYVKGQHENPVDTVQNYKIVLDSITSDDVNYDGLNPNDVDMKGLELTLNEPTDINFIANLLKTVNIETAYNGTRRLTYTLLEHPDGMTISPNSSWISWTAPESAEGNSYPVKIKVENREFSSEISFNVNVANTTTIQTEINGTKIIVTEEGNLKGLVITALDNNINLSDIKLSKTSQNDLLEVPNYITKISDFFIGNEPIFKKIRIKLPLSQLPIGINLNHVRLYHLGTAEGIDEEFWGPVGLAKKIIYEQGKAILELDLYGIRGAFFIGFEEPKFFTPLLQKKSLTLIQKVNISDINCTPVDNNGSLDYMIQNCKVANTNTLAKKSPLSNLLRRMNSPKISNPSRNLLN